MCAEPHAFPQAMTRIPLLLLSLSALIAGTACIPPETSEEAHFPLERGHAGLECTDCHTADTPSPTPRACAACHEGDRPVDHYPGACEECHSDGGWDLAEIDHDPFFPTPHRGVSECGDCHLAAPDFTTFSCIDCHEHRRSRMDNEHLGEVGGYVYESGACLDCHPRGREEDDG